MLKRVLVPVELSSVDARVLAFADGLARYGVRDVVVLHGADLVGVERPVAERQEGELRERLEKFSHAATATHVIPVLDSGNPTDVILRNAKSRDVELIVLATRAKSVLDEFALGSVSESLARRSPVPLLLLPYRPLAESSAEEAREMGQHVFDFVHYPTDFSTIAEHALDFLKRLGSDRLGRVLLTHGIESKSTRADIRDEAERSSLRILEAMRAELGELGIESSAQLLRPPVVDSLLDLTEQKGCTAIAVGSAGHSMGEELLIGSVSLSVLRRSTVPVLLSR